VNGADNESTIISGPLCSVAISAIVIGPPTLTQLPSLHSTMIS